MMRFATLIKNPADWMKGAGPHSDVVMTSRVRLARNLRGYPFPGFSQERQRIELLERARPVVEELPEMRDGYSEDYTDLSKIRKQVLVERHLVSREHAARSSGCAVVVDRKQSISIMINEEDHFRIQGIRPGLNLHSAFEVVDRVDTELEGLLPYAFDPKLGYLTACPTNLGTGMRASVMLHLPALVLTEQINPVIKAIGKIGLAVRGLYGEGTEALGNLFQISNQHTLGEAEPEIIAQIEKVIEGVAKACQGRPVESADLALLAQRVEESLRSDGQAEVEAQEVGMAILAPLRELDEVAYLRYASVYRNFASLEDFEGEIALLRAAPSKVSSNINVSKVINAPKENSLTTK